MSIVDDELIEIETSESLAVVSKSEHEAKVSVAKRYPRSVKQFRNNVTELACLDEETAASCFYVLPRGNKMIEGPSIRFAEIVASSFGNLQFAARVVAIEEKVVVAQGVCYDYEKNNSCSIEIRSRITDKHGNRYNDDMIQMTARSACSKALREAVFKIVPRPYWQSALDEAKKASVGTGKTMEKSRADCFDAWKKAGAKDSQVLAFLGKKGIEDVTIDDLVLLRGLWTAMKEEGVGVDVVLSKDGIASTGKRIEQPEIR